MAKSCAGAVQGAVQSAVKRSGKGGVQGAVKAAEAACVSGEVWERCCAGCCGCCEAAAHSWGNLAKVAQGAQQAGGLVNSCSQCSGKGAVQDAGCCGSAVARSGKGAVQGAVQASAVVRCCASLAKVLCSVLHRLLFRVWWRSLGKMLCRVPECCVGVQGTVQCAGCGAGCCPECSGEVWQRCCAGCCAGC